MTALKVIYKDDTESRQNPSKAKAHAAMLNAKNINNFTLEQIAAAHGLLTEVAKAYTDSRTFINYRDKFISVKIDHPTRANRWSEAADIVDKFAAEQGYEKVVKDSSINFHVA